MIYNSHVTIVIAGAAGNGIATVEEIISNTLRDSGHNLFATKEYMSRIRGGSNSIQLRISAEAVYAPSSSIDLFFPLDRDAYPHVSSRLSETTTLISDPTFMSAGVNFIPVPFLEYAKTIGDVLCVNTIVAGFVIGLFGIEYSRFEAIVQIAFSAKGAVILDKNIKAAGKGWEEGKKVFDIGEIKIGIERTEESKKNIFINGTEAISLGALAGGCNFISSYPMSPGTGVLHFLAQYAREFDVVVDQAEDEIAAINMALGAWYAGARAIVTTSGGGFALMGEGISLAGGSETPVVVHLAQRPGPATGLPTRTEQGDLNLVLYAGHGEFPRVIFAPGTVEDAFYCAQAAFNIADKYQVPVFILTDQYLLDTYVTRPMFDMSLCKTEYFITQSSPEYKRYLLTQDGVSPRAIPGLGEGLVRVDSDEHTESGEITEDSQIRTSMVNKRLKKYIFLQNDSILPELVGSVAYKTLLIGWGSTYAAIKEALSRLGRNDVAFLYCKQIYPLPENMYEYLEKAEQRIIIENNATAQFGSFLEQEFDLPLHECVLKYDGLAFSVEDIVESVRALLEKRNI
jgi:2-oxoglutarate ferredoxin oxidoreductase subunit alpha